MGRDRRAPRTPPPLGPLKGTVSRGGRRPVKGSQGGGARLKGTVQGSAGRLKGPGGWRPVKGCRPGGWRPVKGYRPFWGCHGTFSIRHT